MLGSEKGLLLRGLVPPQDSAIGLQRVVRMTRDALTKGVSSRPTTSKSSRPLRANSYLSLGPVIE